MEEDENKILQRIQHWNAKIKKAEQLEAGERRCQESIAKQSQASEVRMENYKKETLLAHEQKVLQQAILDKRTARTKTAGDDQEAAPAPAPDASA